MKCGQQEHISRECQTGYVNDSGSAILTIEDYSERPYHQNQCKKCKQELGSVNMLASYFARYDSGPDNGD